MTEANGESPEDRLARQIEEILAEVQQQPEADQLGYLKGRLREIPAPRLREALLAAYLHRAAGANLKQVVLLVHGIRTRAEWQEGVVRILGAIPGFQVIPIRYDFFDLLRFLFPFWTREGPITRLAQQLRAARVEYDNAGVSVIAHSYGTYAVCKILLKQPDIEIERLILCGSIIPTAFRWDQVRSRIRRRPIVNECGSRDIWPIIASVTSWGYGPSGTFGFGHVSVRDRFHSLPHSGYFSEEFYRQYWLPLFLSSSGEPPLGPANRPRSPWYFNLLAIIPFQWLTVALLLGVLIVAWRR
jgi:pimeloyl-ACP methyl ester carboxylesterase